MKLPKIAVDKLKYMGADISVLRLDKVDKLVSGNKYYKLKYNLEAAKEHGHQQILTFGGAFSNHIHAVAGACRREGLECIGVIRGEPTMPLNYTLRYATENGMKLHYISREKYRQKYSEPVLEDLKIRFGDFYLVPEGGSNQLAIKGVEEIIDSISNDYNLITVALGTGGTTAGLISGLKGNGKVMAFSSLKGAKGIEQQVKELIASRNPVELNNWEINHDYHFGGYAKFNHELYDFIITFLERHQILLDPVYTGKMMYGLLDQLEKGRISNKNKILALHTGGLQGWHGMAERYDFVNQLLPLD